ncbi:hypothetical protein UCRPA7_7441 [Phaeoacremonium minimum UCRPA7]|uniref:Uncharacterized protein n=1 Tax=Phaeoacremonium minimum (strain UCR-PA7) TaxID=1286976 RepID=R8BCM7_PHAM7|nr:hypothetical protein UCRPA7_7441 [Phaeoacremonium minimum UCRPA7]EON97040.1 hypothetical protein UCRPA7_7441 [Phaeoacremonium minimum UCRPA7]
MNVISQPILQHPGSPQNYPLPESSTFSPVNTAAGNLPNPPLPQNFAVITQEPEHGAVDQNAGLTVQRQVSAVSQVSSLHPSPPQQQEHTIANVISGGINTLPSQSSPHASSPSPQITPDRNVSPEPPAPQSPVNLNVNIQAANNVQEENIYDATPRNSVPPPSRQQQPADVVIESPSAEPASKFAGRPQDHADTRSTISARSDERPKDLVIETAPPVSENTANGHHDRPERPANGNGKPVQSSADIFEEMKRKQLLREQEEKIPVNPTEPDMHAALAAAAKKKDEDDVPQMSATSYPGQEWNPYGGAEYEDWND